MHKNSATWWFNKKKRGDEGKKSLLNAYESSYHESNDTDIKFLFLKIIAFILWPFRNSCNEAQRIKVELLQRTKLEDYIYSMWLLPNCSHGKLDHNHHFIESLEMVFLR